MCAWLLDGPQPLPPCVEAGYRRSKADGPQTCENLFALACSSTVYLGHQHRSIDRVGSMVLWV